MPSAMVSQSPLRVPYAMRNAGPTAGETDVLAGEPSAEYVHWNDLPPVDVVDVTEVRHGWMPRCQQRAYVAIVVGDPGKSGTEDVARGHVEAAVSSTERAEPKSYMFHIPPFHGFR